MQKRIALLFSILSVLGACAMEKDSLLSSYLLAWLPTSQKPLSPMQKVQTSKSEFEKLLYVNSWSLKAESYEFPAMHQLFLNSLINDRPVEFLLYCYNQTKHGNLSIFAISIFAIIDDSLLNKCKEVRINGYSALGAAIAAEDASMLGYKSVIETDGSITVNEYILPIKPRIIQQLLGKGFKLTEKDRKLVALQLYDAIPTEQKQIMISLLQDHQEGDFSVLPHEVRRSIVHYMVRLFKEKEELCVLLQSAL